MAQEQINEMSGAESVVVDITHMGSRYIVVYNNDSGCYSLSKNTSFIGGEGTYFIGGYDDIGPALAEIYNRIGHLNGFAKVN